MIVERYLSTGVATIVALMAARRAASGRSDIRSDAVEEIRFDAEADFAGDHVASRDVVGEWLLSLTAGRRERG
jgi:hypothetical protein